MSCLDSCTLLQRQVEVSGALRTPIRTPADILDVFNTMKALSAFIVKIGRLATKTQLPLEVVFQCLMQIGFGSDVDFDRQHRDGNVPMHQAKVLNRNAQLAAQQVEPKIREVVIDPNEMDGLVANCRTLRHFLRMKVEDGNDLSMARKMVALAEEYLGCLFNLAGGDGEKMLALYMAEDEEALKPLVSGGVQGEGETNDENEEVEIPHNLSHSISSLVSHHLIGKNPPVPGRLSALATILRWLQNVDDDQFAQHVIPSVSTMKEALKAQLGEKRSAICRAACAIVSLLCLRSHPSLFSYPAVKEVFSVWVDVLLKGVHVTVATIACASDSTVRDVVVATEGSSFVMSAVAQASQKAAQPELKRKCLGYLVLGMVCASIAHTARGEAPPKFAFVGHLVPKSVSNGDDGVRRLGRCAAILLQSYDAETAAAVHLDAKVKERAAAETKEVIGAAQIDLFEVGVLRYNEPCPAAALFSEKISCPAPTFSEQQHQPLLQRSPQSFSYKKAEEEIKPKQPQKPAAAAAAATAAVVSEKKKTEKSKSVSLPALTALKKRDSLSPEARAPSSNGPSEKTSPDRVGSASAVVPLSLKSLSFSSSSDWCVVVPSPENTSSLCASLKSKRKLSASRF